MLSTMTKERMEELRYDAQSRIKYRANTWIKDNGRDDGYGRYTVLDRITNRSIVGSNIKTIIKEKHDDLREAGLILRLITSCYGVGLDTVDRMEERKYGFHVRVKVLHNHKQDWELPVWADQHWFRNSPYCFYHDVHVSEENPAMIAYNRSIDNIKRDIQTRTKPGKYLTQFFSDVLTESEIKHWAERQIAHATCEAELKFVENDAPDLWVEVYENGPPSCMKGEDAVGVYCYPDNGLRLAYLESNDEIVARSIVRNSKDSDNHGYVRLYATETRWETKLRDLLAAAGYDKQINLDGVKLKRINADHDGNDGVVCPYIDSGRYGAQDVDIYDDYLKICEGGAVRATNTCGTIQIQEGEVCDDCGSIEHEDDMTYVESCDSNVCQRCLDRNYTYAYGRTSYQDYYPDDEVIYCESDGERYVSEYASNHDVYQCRVTDNWYHIDDMVTVDKGGYEGDLVHTDQAERDELTDLYWCSDDMTWLDGKYVPDEFVGTCHITGNSFDTRFGVALEIGQKRSYYGTPYMHLIYVSPDAWNIDLIRDNFVRCGDLLLPRGYYGNEIVSEFEPSNIEYGDEFESGQFQDLFSDDDEYAEAA